MATTKSSKRKKSTAKVAPTAAGEPRYLAVFNQLCQDITDGVYQVGELLPTEHELCDLFDVSRFTARNALSMLTDAGLVTRRPRVGSVVASQNRRNPYVKHWRRSTTCSSTPNLRVLKFRIGKPSSWTKL